MKTEDQTKNLSNGKVEINDKQEPAQVKKTSAKKETFINRSLRKIGFTLLFIFIGALVAGLLLYLPAKSKLLAAQSELERLAPMEVEFEDLKVAFEDLSAKAAVYKILSNANLMRIALVDNDTNRLNQYIRYIEDDLMDLEITDYTDLPASLSNQFAKVTEKVNSNRLDALDELQAFQNDLLLLIDNLE